MRKLDGRLSSIALRLMGILQYTNRAVQEQYDEIGRFKICGNYQDLPIIWPLPVNIETHLTRPAKFIHGLKLIQSSHQIFRSSLSKPEIGAIDEL